MSLSSFVLLASAALSLSACGIQNSANSISSKGLDPMTNGQVLAQSDRIIGGQVVAPSDVMARRVVALYDVQAKALCTASIVSPTYLITASHCVTPGKTSNLRVVFGTDLTQKSTIVAVAAVIGAVQSPLWRTNQKKDTNTGDIAIVKLATPIPQGFMPATILTDATLIQTGAPVLLEGYGITTSHPDPKSPNDNGAGVLRDVVTTISNAAFSASEVMIDDSQGKGACHGDSGGPAYVKDAKGNVFLFGVTSRGTDVTCSKGVVYTNILAYVKWIPTAVQELEAQAKMVQSAMMPRFISSLQQ